MVGKKLPSFIKNIITKHSNYENYDIKLVIDHLSGKKFACVDRVLERKEKMW